MKGLKRKRYEELDDGYDEEPVHIVGLSMFNVVGRLMSRPMRLPSMFITTKCGIDYESSSISMYRQLPLYGDIKSPLTTVSVFYDVHHNHFKKSCHTLLICAFSHSTWIPSTMKCSESKKY